MTVIDLLLGTKRTLEAADDFVDSLLATARPDRSNAKTENPTAEGTLPSRRIRRSKIDASSKLLRAGNLFVSEKEVQQAIAELSLSPAHVKFVNFALPIENYNVLYNDGKSERAGYVTSLTGTFRGLGQFSRRTWKAIVGRPFSLVADTKVMVKAMCDLYDDSARHFRNSGGRNFDSKVAYLYHNQGASAAIKFLQTGQLVYPKQSERALDLFTEISLVGDHYGFV